jgi:two-component system OmpR family response regulator
MTRMQGGAGIPGTGRETKILVVEDDPGTRAIVARVLKGAGHRVVTAVGGTGALELVTSARPDLVVVDVGLPDIDGFEVCRRIRLDSRVPIVMLAAHDDEDDVLRGFRLGADDYVTEPFSPRVLAARVAAVLRRAAEAAARRRENQTHLGGLELDVPGHEARIDDREVRLTPLEFRLLTSWPPTPVGSCRITG